MFNLRLVLIFYKSTLVLNAICTLLSLCFITAWNWHDASNTAFIQVLGCVLAIQIKLVGYPVVVAYQRIATPNVYYYYRNTGKPMRAMYRDAFAFDFLIYSIFVLTYYIVSK